MAVHSETFASQLKDKNRTVAAQVEKEQLAPNQVNMQQQMMMNMMMMMNMYNNPQQQMMMMQMMTGQTPATQGGFGNGRNNLFVRKAKGKDSPAGGESKQARSYGGHGASTSGRGGQRGDRDAGYTRVDKRNTQERPKQEKQKEEPVRTRLDSDSFPPITGTKKHIVSEPKFTDEGSLHSKVDDEEDKVTRSYLIEYFKANKKSIKIHPNLTKFTANQVPLVEKNPELRVEELNPTPRREFYNPAPANLPSGPSSRKGSISYRKESFNQTAQSKKRTDEDEYVTKE